jgi:hypothetical protein
VHELLAEPTPTTPACSSSHLVDESFASQTELDGTFRADLVGLAEPSTSPESVLPSSSPSADSTSFFEEELVQRMAEAYTMKLEDPKRSRCPAT